MFGKLKNALFGAQREEPRFSAAPPVRKAFGMASVPVVARAAVTPQVEALNIGPVSQALYPGKREDALFLEWVDAVNAHLQLIKQRAPDPDAHVVRWIAVRFLGNKTTDLSEANQTLFGSAQEPAWIRKAIETINSVSLKGLALGNFVGPEIVTGKKKLLSRSEAERLLKLLDRPPLVIEAWNGLSPPLAELLRFDTLDDAASLLTHLGTATSASPSGTWEKTAQALAKKAGADVVRERLTQWLSLLADKSPSPKDVRDASLLWHIGYQMTLLARLRDNGVSPSHAAPLAFLEYDFKPVAPVMHPDMANAFPASDGQPMVLSKENANRARGAVWLLSGLGGTQPALFERLALASLNKYDLGGTYNTRQFCSQALANACIFALGRDGSPDAIMALGRIRRRIRDARIAAQVDKTMQAAAAAVGMSAIDLEETALPDFDIGPEGWTESIDGNELTLEIKTGGTEITCTSPSGKALKSLPAAVKSTEACKDMKAAADEIDALLPLIRWRLESSWLGHRKWPLENWRERYGEHPVARAVATPLIWWIEREGRMTSAMWRGGKFFDVGGGEIATDGAGIRLWHPIEDIAGNVVAWRRHLVENRIVQPFKQAHREVYPLTDAERETGTFSNRYAAHILKQHQYMALAKSRGWKASHRMNVDAPNDAPVMIDLPAWKFWAEIFIEGAGGDDPETVDSGAYVYVSTDQVRFHGASGRLNLAEVPPLAFSEVMRDCDLFVGVASIGADPNWNNGGADARRPNQWERHAADYWHRMSFETLSESAKLRKELVAELLPSMTIAPLCEIHDKYLRVKGKLRTYRIHFNSGNILMEPNDAYLCIVPANVAPSGDKIYVPFEGDRLLSIILSKAIMLANDSAIREQHIMNQISR